MLRNYLKIAIRSLVKSKTHTLINIVGLGVGIACCLLIVLFVKDEWTFDTFHTKANRIYRAWTLEDAGTQYFNAVTPFPLGPTLKDNFAEVEEISTVHDVAGLVKVGDDQYSEKVTIGGVHFFDIFDFNTINGDAKEALSSVSGVVLSRRFATKYFGDADPINKVIAIQLADKFEDFSVKAVTENVPTNSSIQYDILISDLNSTKIYSAHTLNSAWFNITAETYVLFKPDANPEAVAEKFKPLIKKILVDFEGEYSVGFQPITDIHLNTDIPAGLAPVSNPQYSYILGGIALLILLVACINFVTLSVGRSMKRAKEVGVRKVVGAERKHLIFQFIGEAVIITIVSLAAGVVLAAVSVPLFNDLAGKNLALEMNGFVLSVSLSLVIVIGLFAGSYPAFVLSGFRPVTILKGSINVGSSKQRLRKVLVGVQLVLCIFLISSTLIMREQLQFLQNKDLGFNKEQVMVAQLNVPGNLRFSQSIEAGFEKLKQFKLELDKIPGIVSVFGASQDFGNGNWISIGYTDTQGQNRNFNLNVVDENYIPGMNMEIVQGRNFSEDIPSDQRRAIIINEAFAREYGWTDPIGKRLPGDRFGDHEVIGVVKDFNYNSLYTKIEPVMFVSDINVIRSGIENVNVNSSPVPKLMIRLSPGEMKESIAAIESVWSKLTGGEEFAFSFIDQAMDKQYRNDQNLSKIISVATLLAILIGGLGLYALASLAMQNRIKEISIRKVMGATEQSLLVLLSKDYVYLIGISLLVSVPITYYMMTGWLESFEYRIGISWQVFAIAGSISLVIALVTISYQAIKTAWSQPARTLKYE